MIRYLTTNGLFQRLLLFWRSRKKDMATATVKVEQISSTASQGNARGHLVVMDRPEAKGGTNEGMMGGEAVLNGLGGCFMSNLLAAAKARNIELKNARAC